jgi:drug/metabolite transporter (DMT)-like permease
VLAVGLAALSALVWGGADYCGGKATQRNSALAVTVASQLLGVPILMLAVLTIPGVLRLGDLGWGAGAGLAGLFGIVLLYRGLSTGSMAVVAPITAVTSALVPLIVGLATEATPPALALAGALCAVSAIALVSLGPSRGGGRVSASIIGLALASGAMFGIFFTLLAQTHDDSGMWPLVAVRACSIALGLLLVVTWGLSLRPTRGTLRLVVFAGVGDIAANALYLLSAREGLLSVVAPIAALYPASTVLLALAIDKERVRPVQIAGLGLAATALVLTAV